MRVESLFIFFFFSFEIWLLIETHGSSLLSTVSMVVVGAVCQYTFALKKPCSALGGLVWMTHVGFSLSSGIQVLG